MFDLVVVQPIFNLLMLIYSLIPDFGVAIILFTIIIRLLLWPLVKKQLHQAKAMKRMQPELVALRKKYKNNRQMQGIAMMELYKKHNISPFGSIAVMFIQLPILIGMYSVVQIFVNHRDALGKYTYGFLEQLPVAHNLVYHPDQFNQNFLGIMDLTKQALSPQGVVPGLLLLIVIAAVLQYLMSRQLSPHSDSQRRLRDVMSEAASGKEADQAEVNAIMMRKMMKLMPVMLMFIMVGLPGALSLYMATANAVGYLQNLIIMRQDETELVTIAKQTTAAKAKKSQRASAATEAQITRIKAKE